MRINQHLKNIRGWKTKRRIIVLAVDDYGNIRISSRKARENLDKAGFSSQNRFDNFDTLETEDDLNALYETLDSVKDKHGNPAIFTALSLPVNINFDKIIESGYSGYYYEPLNETFSKISGYQNVWNLWKEGIERKLIFPQFHGREHLNLKLFKENLIKKDPETIACINNKSYVRISNNPYKTIRPSGAFGFDDFSETEEHKIIIKDGLDLFENVFGFRSDTFNAPGDRDHSILHKTLSDGGVKYLETPLVKNEHQGNGKYKRIFNYTSKRNEFGQTFLVRNCQFEPSSPKKKVDWVEYCLKQIKIAFYWNNPAIISSHRVNFCGLMDENNRAMGLSTLKTLLEQIVKEWPNVEFMTIPQLGDLMTNNS
jgi:hypothetical protein